MRSAAPVFGASAMVGTRPMIFSCPSHCVRDARSKSSTASTVVSRRSTAAARHASRTSLNTMNALALNGWSTTVLYVACETNPRVPSLPIIKRLMISIGSEIGWSTNAFMEYPVVHLIACFFVISADSVLSACTRDARFTTPSTSVLCDTRNDARESASAVSSTVPSTNTIRISFRVWYVFCFTPQHIPDELFATTPPIIHESMDEGSGPILYCTSRPCCCLYFANKRFTSPRINPGSTVISLPPFLIS
mmetsp:Transcript_11511/g.38038  ORF Transcript_11511/g.38038 Transcript_11511/m.38038 type:complete len:249 (+) Transcript_11511:1956-2702(+)